MNKLQTVGLLLISLMLFSCSDDRISSYSPETIKVGILPDTSKSAINENYAPLLEYLENETGHKLKLVIPKNYTHLLELFQNKEVDMAYFGAYTFWQANKNSNAQPLIMRNVDAEFSSYIFSNTDTDLNTLGDLKNQTISFGSKFSTSGHIMPRFYLEEINIKPETYFSKILYSGSHDKTIENVVSGKTKAGVINALILENYISKKNHIPVNIIWISPTYPDYVWAVQNNLSETLIKKIHNAYLDLSIDKHSNILKPLQAEYFISASLNDFAQLERALKKIKP